MRLANIAIASSLAGETQGRRQRAAAVEDEAGSGVGEGGRQSPSAAEILKELVDDHRGAVGDEGASCSRPESSIQPADALLETAHAQESRLLTPDLLHTQLCNRPLSHARAQEPSAWGFTCLATSWMSRIVDFLPSSPVVSPWTRDFTTSAGHATAQPSVVQTPPFTGNRMLTVSMTSARLEAFSRTNTALYMTSKHLP